MLGSAPFLVPGKDRPGRVLDLEIVWWPRRKALLRLRASLPPCFQTGNIIGDGWWVDNVETLMECSVHMLVMKALI